MVITAFNPETDELEKSYLTAPTDAGATTLLIKNNDRMSATDKILIGEMGGEKSEVATISSISGADTIISSATNFSHSSDDPVFVLRFDQIKFYRSTDGETGTYSLLSTQDIDVDNANLTTTYDDTTGLSTYYYKISYYNSVNTVESDLSDPIPGVGYDRTKVGGVIDELLTEFGDSADGSIDRKEVIAWMNEVNDDLHTRVQKPYEFLHTSEALARTADTDYVALPTDSNGNQKMWKFDFLVHNYNDGTTDKDYIIEMLPIEDFMTRYQDNTIDSTTVDDEIMYGAIDTANDRILFYPPAESTDSDAFTLYYWKYLTELDSDGDAIETPGTKIYKDYVRARYYRKLSRRESSYRQVSNEYMLDYEREVVKLQRHNRKDTGSPRSFGGRGGQNARGWRR